MEQNILLDAPTAAVIVAAGLSSRMRGIDKILAPLRDEPVLWHTLHAFEQCEAIGEIVVVTRSILIQAVQDMIRARGLHKVWHVVEGGETRQQSTYKGVCALSSGSSLVCVHDGARPLVSGQVILAAISAARNHGAATAAIPVKDTIKEEHNGFVACTYDRNHLMAVQTPQVFDRALYLYAHTAAQTEYNDDCQMLESVGIRVAISKGDECNIKLTTPDDFVVAEAFLGRRDGQ